MSTELTTTNPSHLIQLAVEANSSPENLSKLMDLQERWMAGQARTDFYNAFSSFQSELPPILKTKAGHNYSYAPLSDIVEIIKPFMLKNKLTYRFEQSHEDGIEITCIVTHTSGHSERTTMKADADTSGSKNGVQAVASTVSYLSRYTLTGALGIATADQDMDGRLAKGDSAQNGDLIQYLECARDNFVSIVAIKTGISDGNLSEAKEAWQEIEQSAMVTLWRAPSKGSLFTTKERTVMKSNEWSALNGGSEE